MLGIKLDSQEIRLVYWQRLLRGDPVEISDIDSQLLGLVREATTDERRAFVLLRACVELFNTGSDAARRNLRGTLIYWFSNVGSRDESSTGTGFTDIRDLMGRHLTWAECIREVGGNPDAYSARSRTVEKLQNAAKESWKELFGEELPMTGDFHA